MLLDAARVVRRFLKLTPWSRPTVLLPDISLPFKNLNIILRPWEKRISKMRKIIISLIIYLEKEQWGWFKKNDS